MKLRCAFILISLALGVLLTGCGRDNQPRERTTKLTKYSDLGPPPTAEASADTDTGPARMIARTASIIGEVESCDSALYRIQHLIVSLGGYLTETSLDGTVGSRKTCIIKGRVPAEALDSTLAVLPKIISKINGVRTTGTDITDDYYDTVGRLENRRALRESYRSLMKRAGTMQDLLEIQKALAEIDDEIDTLEGRRQSLSGRAEMASISLHLEEPAPPAPTHRYGFWDRVRHGIEGGIDGFGDVLSYILTILIAFVPAAVVIVLVVIVIAHIIRLIRRARRRRKRPTEPS